MLLVDTNVMIYAHRRDAERHIEYRDWMSGLINGAEPYAVSDFAVTGMIRIVTNPRSFPVGTSMIEEALAYADEIRNQPHAHVVAPGPRFWSIFTSLCREVKTSAKLVPDAYLAALAIEHGCEFVSEDADYSRFHGLRWRRALN